MHFLEKHRLFNPSITHLLELVLELHHFEFNGKHYLQAGRTAIGTKVAQAPSQHIHEGL